MSRCNSAFIEGYVEGSSPKSLGSMFDKAIVILNNRNDRPTIVTMIATVLATAIDAIMGESAECPYGVFSICPHNVAAQCITKTVERTPNDITDCWLRFLDRD
jgi:hypothetical protein